MGEVISGDRVKMRCVATPPPAELDVKPAAQPEIQQPNPVPMIVSETKPSANPPSTPLQSKTTHDAFLAALEAFTRRPAHPLPPGFIKFDKHALAQPELSALMGYEGDSTGNYPNFRKTLREVSDYGHAGLILYMTDALQDYLSMQNTLKQLPDFMRLTEED